MNVQALNTDFSNYSQCIQQFRDIVNSWIEPLIKSERYSRKFWIGVCQVNERP